MLTTLTYLDIGPFPGKVEIYASKKNVIVGVTIFPQAPLSTVQIERVYGHNYRKANFEFEPCLTTKDDGAPLYETKDGQFQYIIYDQLGLAIPIPATNVLYLQYPLGPKKSVCLGKARTVR